MLLIRIFVIIFPIFAITATGYFYGRWKRPEMTFANQLNMDVFVPALVFSVLSSKAFELGTFAPLALGTLVVVLGSGLVVLPVVMAARINPKTFIPPMMFVNSGNMGLPLAVFAFGDAALPAAVVMFVVSNFTHFTLGQYIMDHRAGLGRVFKMPMFIAALFGVCASILDITVPGPIAVTFEMLGQVSIPLLLFSLGVRLIDLDFSGWRLGLLGAVLCPLSGVLVAALVIPFLPLESAHRNLLWVFAVLPPAVLNYIVAENYQQEPTKVASIVMMGNLATVITLPLVLTFVLPDAFG